MAIKRGSKRWNEAMKDIKEQLDEQDRGMRQKLFRYSLEHPGEQCGNKDE